MSRSFVLRLATGAALIGLLAVALPFSPFNAFAASPQQVSLGPSGLPLPRFVSLKSGRVNLRIGPGLGYAVDWMYLKPGLPVEIIQEYDNWRRVRDAEGSEGWINQSLLSGRRTGIAAPWQKGKQAVIPMRKSPDRSSPEVAQIEPGVVGTILACDGDWCSFSVEGHTGWVQQTQLWGAYPGERFKD